MPSASTQSRNHHPIPSDEGVEKPAMPGDLVDYEASPQDPIANNAERQTDDFEPSSAIPVSEEVHNHQIAVELRRIGEKLVQWRGDAIVAGSPSDTRSFRRSN